MAEIGKKIKKRRESLGITQEELAAKLGYKNKSSIAKIETGANDIVQSKVLEFAKALDTTVAYLMGWNDNSASAMVLTETEKLIITEYRRADDITQAMVLRALNIDKVTDDRRTRDYKELP